MSEQQNQSKTQALAALILGVISLGAWFIPIIGFAVSFAGITMGVKSMKSEHKNMAIAGLALSVIGLLITIVNVVLGALMVVDALAYL